MDHGLAVVELAHRHGLDPVYVHAFLDGRDEPPASAAGFVRTFEEGLARIGTGRIVTVSGRYWAMDRDRRWDRTARAYEVLAGTGDGTAARGRRLHRGSLRGRGQRRVHRAGLDRAPGAPSGCASRTAIRSSSSISGPTGHARSPTRWSTGTSTGLHPLAARRRPAHGRVHRVRGGPAGPRRLPVRGGARDPRRGGERPRAAPVPRRRDREVRPRHLLHQRRPRGSRSPARTGCSSPRRRWPPTTSRRR